MAHLRKTGRDKDTLIFFFSDNGGSGRKPFLAYNTAVNTPLRGDKGQTLEGGIRVPFFVSWPGKLPAGKTYDQPVTALDILPTACAVAGAKADADLDGVNLLPHLTGDKRRSAARSALLAVRPAEGDSQRPAGSSWTGAISTTEAEQRLAALRPRPGHRREERPGSSAAAARRRTRRRLGQVEHAQHRPALARRRHRRPNRAGKPGTGESERQERIWTRGCTMKQLVKHQKQRQRFCFPRLQAHNLELWF